MIWHLLEIWLLLFGAFVIGCLLGSLLYGVLASSPLADIQGVVADAIGDWIDGIKVRLGMAPAWRPGYGHGHSRIGRPFDEPARAAPTEELHVEARSSLPEPEHLEVVEDANRLDVDWERPEVEITDWDDGAADWEHHEVIEAEPVVPPPAPPPVETGSRPELPAMRPAGLAAPRNGVPDDLQRIRGIGQRNEELLNGLGIYHFSQIAAWTPAEVRWVSAFLAFPERIERDDWIGQATILGSGGDTGYVKPDRRRPRREAEAEEALPEE